MLCSLERFVHSQWKPHYSRHYSMSESRRLVCADGFLKTMVLNVYRVIFQAVKSTCREFVCVLTAADLCSDTLLSAVSFSTPMRRG